MGIELANNKWESNLYDIKSNTSVVVGGGVVSIISFNLRRMVNCCAACCKSGYTSTKSEETEHVHWHSFPADAEKKEIWYNKIPREKWELPKYPGICHKHFLPTDYGTERTDKQSRRKKKKGVGGGEG